MSTSGDRSTNGRKRPASTSPARTAASPLTPKAQRLHLDAEIRKGQAAIQELKKIDAARDHKLNSLDDAAKNTAKDLEK